MSQFKAFIKKRGGMILKCSAVLLALCYALCYAGGVSKSPVFMGFSLGVLILANLLAAA